MLFGEPARYAAIPAAGLLVWFLVLRGSFRVVERVLLLLTLIYGGYIVSAFLAHPALTPPALKSRRHIRATG